MALKALFFKSIAVDVAVANESEPEANIGVDVLERGDERRGAVVCECVVELGFGKKFVAPF